MIKELSQCKTEALKAKKTRELLADFKIEVEGKFWTCYTVAVSYRELTCYCNEGTATYFVDSYGDRHVMELFDWEKAV